MTCTQMKDMKTQSCSGVCFVPSSVTVHICVHKNLYVRIYSTEESVVFVPEKKNKKTFKFINVI